MSIALSHRKALKDLIPWAAVALCLVLLLGSVALHDPLFHGRTLRASPAQPPPAEPGGAGNPASTTLTLPEGKWKTAGIQLGQVTRMALPSEVGISARIEANPERRVDVRPRAAGVIRDVHAKLGQKVKKGDVLVVLDSPDIGTARLTLRGRQIELATARAELDWKREIAENVARLIPELNKGVPAETIEKEFADRPLGADRGLLLQAYAEFENASHEAEKTSKLYNEKIYGEHPALIAMHTLEGLRSKFRGILEQVKFDAKHELTLVQQKVRLAEAAVIDAAQRLRILGIAEDIEALLARAVDVDAATRSSLTEDLTAYPVTAPFDGTIIDKKALTVPSQKADVTDVLVVLADLSTVRVMGNITESDLAILPGLKEGAIRLTATAYPGQTFEARILSVGAMVDMATRTVPLLAETDNPEGLLKLNMFARIVLDTPTSQSMLTVPTAAAIEIDSQPGVFVPSSKDPSGRTFTFRPVKLGRTTGDRQVVLDGLTQGESVVTAGAFFLKSELILQNEPEED